MKNNEFDKKIRAFENSNDPRIHPNKQVVIRIDGKNFSNLTRKVLKIPPFNYDLRDAMWSTLQHIMTRDFKTLYGYTQSDELSVLLDPFTTLSTFSGKIRKILFIMASEASVHFSTKLNMHCIFDCIVIQLPTRDDVLDYTN